jgi:hypothetical protein
MRARGRDGTHPSSSKLVANDSRTSSEGASPALRIYTVVRSANGKSCGFDTVS